MARSRVAHNHLEEKVDIVTGDIKEAAELFGPASFDVITTNPPYMIGHHGIENPSDAKAIARHEVLCDLNDILRESARILKPRGRFYMVHPFVHKEPNMVLIEGMRGANSRMRVEPPLIVYKEQGVYSEELLSEYAMK